MARTFWRTIDFTTPYPMRRFVDDVFKAIGGGYDVTATIAARYGDSARALVRIDAKVK